jgi:MoxR-like ATPase
MTTAPPEKSAPPVSPLHILQHKRMAELCEGAFSRYHPVLPDERSRYSPTDPTTGVELGLGYVQATLAALHGVVLTCTYDPPGARGRVELRSTGGAAVYCLSWREDDQLLMGGFQHSAGQPTYQAALVALVQAIALYRSGVLAQSEELVARWFALVQALDRTHARMSSTSGWDRPTLALACRHPNIRSHITRVCDALRTCLSYRLPELRPRDALVTAGDVLELAEGNTIIIPGAVLLNPSGVTPEPACVPVSLPAPEGVALTSVPDDSTLSTPPTPEAPPKRRARSSHRAAPAVPPPPAEPRPASESPVAAAHTTRIQLALERGGPLMLVGPTATGKTTQAIAAALAGGWGVEAITLDAGWEADDLFGSFTRTRRDREWAFVPGPVTRWAERAVAGERVVLLLDELARGHATVISAVMRLLNEHTRAAVAVMNLPIPDGEDGPFHIVDVRATQQRLVLPCRRVRIIATANQGEQYTGLDLGDPAFGRRWTGGWLYLTGYDSDETARILAVRLGLPPSAPLIRAMQQVALQVLAYQQKEETLRATLDLATLIAWGRTALTLFGHDHASSHSDSRRAFLEAARDTWLDRLCPLAGAQLDPQVERALVAFVTDAAPAALS